MTGSSVTMRLQERTREVPAVASPVVDEQEALQQRLLAAEREAIRCRAYAAPLPTDAQARTLAVLFPCPGGRT